MSKRIVMVIDQRRCIGCHTCAIACKSANNVPKNYKFNRVLTGAGEYSYDKPIGTQLGSTCTSTVTDLKLTYYTKACQHCGEAPCVAHCPTNATYRRSDGIVMMEPSMCVGCGICLDDCAYASGGANEMRVLYSNPEFYQQPVGDPNCLEVADNIVGKCTFCAHRLDNGLPAACIELCPGRARFMGNINDTSSEVYRLVYLSGREIDHIQPVGSTVSNTDPSVYLLKP